MVSRLAEILDPYKPRCAFSLRTQLLLKKQTLSFEVFFFRSLVSICLLLCQGHSIHSFAVIQLSCSQETREKMWNVVVKVSFRKELKILKYGLPTSCKLTSL